MQHVYVVGSKGLPGSYGGYETFLDKLTEYHQRNIDIKYHIACKANGDGVSKELDSMPDRFIYHNADCFNDENDNYYKDRDEDLIEYDSLEEAIEHVGSKDNSEYVMVIGLNDPHKDDIKINEEDSIITDAPEKEEKTC